MYYCGNVIVVKEAKLLSLPLPQLAVSNGRWFHLQLGILLSLCPASLMHKNPQRHKIIIHDMHPVGHNYQTIDLNIL